MTLLEKIEQNKEDLLNIRHQIHRHPETAFEEIETTKLIKKVLDDAGIENHPNGDSTGVIGLIHGAKEGPVLAIRADIDALPIKENTGLPFSSEVSGQMPRLRPRSPHNRPHRCSKIIKRIPE